MIILVVYFGGVGSSRLCVEPALVQANWCAVPQASNRWLGIRDAKEEVLVVYIGVNTQESSILDFCCGTFGKVLAAHQASGKRQGQCSSAQHDGQLK
jgi:hypothetical protein